MTFIHPFNLVGCDPENHIGEASKWWIGCESARKHPVRTTKLMAIAGGRRIASKVKVNE
jgi:hypothetical protein